MSRIRTAIAAQPPTLERLELLVIQASPFCNLDCSYCYLPDRADSRCMSLPTLEILLQRVFAPNRSNNSRGATLEGPTPAPLTLVWHAGEPMTVSRVWYEQAFSLIARYATSRPVRHHFQTNAVLIDAAWCEFFSRHQVRVGVSIDGPALLHDRHRRTRDGRPTHARVMRGIGQLQAAGLSFHAIGVLTRDSLAYADEVYAFFRGLGVTQVGFNIEEIESAHTHSSLAQADIPLQLKVFWRRLLELLHEDSGQLHVREIDAVLEALRHPQFGKLNGNAQNQPGSILSVSWDGRFTFWSPELLGCRHPQLGPVEIGDIDTDDPFDPAALPRLAAFQREIDVGVRNCRAECKYFDFCRGGAPANKLAELGSFDGTETMACRLNQKIIIDVVLDALDRKLAPAPDAQPRFATSVRMS